MNYLGRPSDIKKNTIGLSVYKEYTFPNFSKLKRLYIVEKGELLRDLQGSGHCLFQYTVQVFA